MLRNRCGNPVGKNGRTMVGIRAAVDNRQLCTGIRRTIQSGIDSDFPRDSTGLGDFSTEKDVPCYDDDELQISVLYLGSLKEC
jgi:hypothetical protein